MKIDDEEQEIFCGECYGYLWSVSIHDEKPSIIPCPYQRDPMGQCTGKPKKAVRSGVDWSKVPERMSPSEYGKGLPGDEW